MNVKRAGHTLSVGAVPDSIQQRSAEDSDLLAAKRFGFPAVVVGSGEEA